MNKLTFQTILEKIRDCYSIDLSKFKNLGYPLEILLSEEKKFGNKFPESYKSFLAQFGVIYAIFCGEDRIEPVYIQENQEWFQETLQNEQTVLNNTNMFVFAVHDGYEYWYLELDNLSGNAPVYLYQSWKNLIELDQDVSEFILSEIMRKIELAMRSSNFFDFTKSLLMKILSEDSTLV
jgi:SMI1-KNR4 cell-wall